MYDNMSFLCRHTAVFSLVVESFFPGAILTLPLSESVAPIEKERYQHEYDEVYEVYNLPFYT